MVRTHVQGAAIVLPILADEDRVDRLFMGRLPDYCDGGVTQSSSIGRVLFVHATA